jgi:hypothetical protein
LTCYREQAKVSSVRTREYIHAGIFPYLKRMQNTEIHVFDEALVRKLIKSITVYADKFTVEFKSGISVDIAE